MSSLSVLFLNVVNTFDNAEILFSTVLLNSEQTSCIHVVRVHIDYEVLETLQFLLSVVMIAQQLLYLSCLGFFQGNIVRVAAKNVLELALQLIYVVVVLASEVEFDLLVLYLSSLFFFGSLVKVFSQILNDTVVVMAVLFPELTQLLRGALRDLKCGLSNFKSLLSQFFEIFFFKIFLVDCKVAFSFVESDVGRVNIVIFEKAFLDISEGNCLFFVN